MESWSFSRYLISDKELSGVKDRVLRLLPSLEVEVHKFEYSM